MFSSLFDLSVIVSFDLFKLSKFLFFSSLVDLSAIVSLDLFKFSDLLCFSSLADHCSLLSFALHSILFILAHNKNDDDLCSLTILFLVSSVIEELQ